MVKKIIFVLSPGRSGTQWMWNMLKTCYSDTCTADHEKLKGIYYAVDYYRDYRNLLRILNNSNVLKFIENLNNLRKNQKLHYIETGWSSYSLIPLFAKLYPSVFKLVHLVRNPVEAAISISTHRMRKEGHPYSQTAMINPLQHRTIIKGRFQKDWYKLTPYEKNLFQWTELNHYFLELKRKLRRVPYLRITKEDLFNPSSKDTLRKLLEFFELPLRQSALDMINQNFDRHRLKLKFDVKVDDVFNYKPTIRIARKFGYSKKELVNSSYINERYIT